MNTSFIRIVAVFCVAILSIINVNNSLAGSYTWTGSANKDWQNSANWSPSGIPGTSDTVTIGSGSDTIQIGANITINRLVMSGRTLHLNENELQISQRATLNGGKIYNGTLKMRGTYAFFQGTNTNCTIDCVVNQIKFSGGTFDGMGSFEHNGSAHGWGEGGCVFNDSITIKSSGTSYLRMGQERGDTFNGVVEFISSGTYPLQVAYHDSTIFKMPVRINSTSGGISFCNDTTVQAAVFQGEAFLIVGSTGITGGTITLKNIYQETTNAVKLTASGSALITVVNSTFNGKLAITSPGVLSKNSIYNDSTSFTRIANNTTAYQWDGGNTFHGVFTLTSTNTSTGVLRMANKTGDKYNADAYFNTTSTAGMEIAYSDTSEFNGNIFINHSKVVFNKSKGVVRLTGDVNQELQGNATFLIGKLKLNKDGGSVTLNRSMTIDSSITFINGIIKTDSTITLKAAVNCSGASNLSFVDGPVKKIGNTAFVFPVGDQGQWNPIEITAPVNATDAFTAKFHLSKQNLGDAKDTTIYMLSKCSYWELNRNNGTSQIKVALYWDSIACGIYDTTQLKIASWNGTKWKDIGRDTIIGDYDSGKILNDSSITQFLYFSIAYGWRGSPGFATISPKLNSDLQNLEWNHPIADDYFGYNGANVLFQGQAWYDLFNPLLLGTPPVLKKTSASMLRFQGGTVGNYWDWRTGWFIPEIELPNDWFYLEYTHNGSSPTVTISGETQNSNLFRHFKPNSDLLASRPMYQLNNLTSDFHYQLASLYRANEENLPVRYIELGEEFYLNDEHYKEVFPSVVDYTNLANQWCSDLKNFTPFESTEVAIVGCSSDDSSPGRRRMWMQQVLYNINTGAHRPDAVTIHEYYLDGINGVISPTRIQKMMIKAFDETQKLFDNEIAAIDAKSASSSLNPPLQAWISEFNLTDKDSRNIGTWSHGLFTAVQTLRFLESSTITRICSHAMTADAVFGNIFESTTGFSQMQQSQLPYNIPDQNLYATRLFEFTAIGTALDQIAKAMRGSNIVARKIDFSDDAASIHNLAINASTTSQYLKLYGWVFEKAEGTEAVILNLGEETYDLNYSNLFATQGGVNFERITAIDELAGIIGNPSLNSTPLQVEELLTTQETPAGISIELNPFSITRLIQRKQDQFTIRLSDNEVCSGSEFTAVIIGADGPLTFNLLTVNGSTADSVITFTAPLVTSTQVCTLQVSETVNGNIITNTALITIHPSIEVSVNVTGDLNSCSGVIELEAQITPSTFPPTGYTYLWVPSIGIDDGNPMKKKITVDPTSYQAYQAYVFDGRCWAHSDSQIVQRSAVEVDLGEDLHICEFTTSEQPIKLSPKISGSNPNYTYSWSGSSVTVDQLTITSLNTGTYTYTVTVTNGNGCTNTDQIQVFVHPCCTCDITLKPHSLSSLPGTNASHENDLVSLIDNLETSTSITEELISIGGGGNTFSYLFFKDTDPALGNRICVNGDFWLRRSQNYDNIWFRNITFNLGPEARITLRAGSNVIFESCTLKTCDGQTEVWDGIYMNNEDQNQVISSLEFDQFSLAGENLIENARNAIVLARENEFQIENTVFNDNYIDILMSKYQKKINQDALGGQSGKNYIHSNTFTSSGNTLLAPYNNVHKFAAIVLDDVERVVIGDSSLNTSVSANEISSSRYGVVSHNSSVELFKSNFNDLNGYSEVWPLPFSTPVNELKSRSIGIYALGVFDYNDRHLWVGERTVQNGSVSRNDFRNLDFGIWSDYEMNIEVHHTDFGEGDQDVINGMNAIRIMQPGGKYIAITKDNHFSNYILGLRMFQPTSQTSIDIGENIFYKGFPGNTNFVGTGVFIHNWGLTEPALFAIHDNTFGTSVGQDMLSPRIGIRVANIVNSLIIEDNNFNYNFSDVPADFNTGIWLTNCAKAKVKSNRLENVGSPTNIEDFEQALSGIRIQNSMFTCLDNQTFTFIGQPMRFFGNSVVQSLYNNTMDHFSQGIFLDVAEIGQNIPSVNVANGSGYVDFVNDWIQNSGADFTRRIAGQRKIPGVIDWWHTASGQTDDRFPGGGAALIRERQIPFNTSIFNTSLCIVEDTGEPPVDLTARNANFGGVAADTFRYEANYANARYEGSLELFMLLKKYPSLLDFDDSSDVSFQDFYEARLNSNFNKVVDVMDFLQESDYEMANYVLSSITDTCDWETNFKTVMGRYINHMTGEKIFTGRDSVLLDSIAQLNAYAFGLPVLLARNILDLEIYDTPSGGSRIFQATSTKQLPGTLQLIPNPTGNKVRILIPEQEVILDIVVYDHTGRVVFTGEGNTLLDVHGLSIGVYLVSVKTDVALRQQKLMVVR